MGSRVAIINKDCEDEVFATPIIDILTFYDMKIIEQEEYFKGQMLEDLDLMVNVITRKFLNSERCIKDMEMGNRGARKSVNLVFVKNDIVEQSGIKLLGDVLYLDKRIDEYLMLAIYNQEPFSTYFRGAELQDTIKNVIHGYVQPKPIEIGDEETIILAMGSMGYSTARMWTEKYQVKSKIFVFVKNKSVAYGQQELDESINTWEMNMDECSEKGDDLITKLDNTIDQWLEQNVKNEKLVIIGGIGKSTSSLFMPMIIKRAKLQGIKMYTLCTLPFAFESSNIRILAERSFDIIRNITDNIVYFDGSEIDSSETVNVEIKMDEWFEMLAYAMGVAINCEIKGEEKKITKLTLIKRNNKKMGNVVAQYGEYDVKLEKVIRRQKVFGGGIVK